MCYFCNSTSSSYSLFVYLFIYLHPEYTLKTFTLIPKTGKDTIRKLQISFKNIDLEILNNIQANQSSTLKGLYIMTKWDLFLEFENELMDKNWSMWYVNLIEWREKKNKIISVDSIKEWQNSTSFPNKKHLMN